MNLLKTLATISGMTMLSRLTGLLREGLIAHAFGTSALTDAFNVAFRIPNLLRRLFAEGAFSQAFVPILAEYKTRKGEAETKLLVNHVASTLVWATLLVTMLGIAFAPVLVYVIATGFADSPQALNSGVFMTRIMFPYICCMSFVALAGGVLNTWREFKIPAFTPVLLNLSFIAASLFLAPLLPEPVIALAVAVLVGGLLQVAIQLPALIRIGMLPRISLNPLAGLKDEGVRRVLKKMGPAIFAVSASQISMLINTNIASNLAQGSISWLSYADRLMELPSALLGVALGTVLLPSLSKASQEGDSKEYSALLDWGLRLSFLLALPAAVGLAVLSVPLTATLFHHGLFTARDVAMSAQALLAYGVGLGGIIMIKVLAPAFYAKQDIRTPVKIALGVLLATQMLNLLFVPWLAVAGLALSTGIGACINAGLLYRGLRAKGLYQPQPGWAMFLFKLCAALLLMAGIAGAAAEQFHWLEMRAHYLLRAGALALVVSASAAAYFAALFAMGFRLRDFKRIAR